MERDVFARLGMATDAVFGAIQCHQFEVRFLAETVDDAGQAPVNTSVISDQPNTFALRQIETRFQEYLYPRLNGSPSRQLHRQTIVA